jgi:hypothetical protein
MSLAGITKSISSRGVSRLVALCETRVEAPACCTN